MRRRMEENFAGYTNGAEWARMGTNGGARLSQIISLVRLTAKKLGSQYRQDQLSAVEDPGE